jgi:hypothetical protein
MEQLLFHYIGYVFVFALIAFAAILARPEVLRPREIGAGRLVSLFFVVWAVSSICFMVLSVVTAFIGLPNEGLVETTYGILGGIAGHFTGYRIFARSLRRRSDSNVAGD